MKKIMLTAMFAMVGLVTQASIVNLNLSGSYDYDAYVTDIEIAANGNAVMTALGDHSIQQGTTGYAHLVAPTGPVYKGITNSFVNGGQFELAAGLINKFGTATGTAKVNNSIARLNTQLANQTTRTATIMLDVGQQAKYSDFNLLVNGDRYNFRSGVTMGAYLDVKYVGDANWYTIWSESVNISVAGTYGGVFGGQMSGTTASFQSSAWQAVIVNDVVANGIFKGPTTGPASGTDTMWKLATPATLDNTKVLEGFRMTSTTTDAARYNDFILYAASATPMVVPEPATIGMLGLGVMITLLFRRLRS